MSKKITTPTVRIPFVTSNGVHLAVESWPNPEMSSDRHDARVIGHDFNDIRTDVYLGKEKLFRLIGGISELEDEDESIRNDALSYLEEDTFELIKALGCNDDDLQRLQTDILHSRNQVKQQEAL